MRNGARRQRRGLRTSRTRWTKRWGWRRVSASGKRMHGEWWPNAPWPADSTAAPRAIATRSSCMWTPARSQKMLTFPRERPRRHSATIRRTELRCAVRGRGGPGQPPARLHRVRQHWKKQAASMSLPQPPGGWPATPQRSRCGMVRTGRCSTSAARPARSPLPCAGRWRLATGSADSPDARPAAAMRITYGTGRMAGRRRSTIWCCSAGGIIGRCTRRDSKSPSTRAEQRRSCGPTAPTARSTVDTELDRLAAGADVEAVGGSRHRHRRNHRHAGVARRAAGPEMGDRNPVAAAPRHGHGARRSRGNVRPVTAAWNQ